MFSKIKIRNSIATKAALAAVAVCVASPAAMAAVVCNNTPISVPATIAGIYVNMVTGAVATADFAGADFNAYDNSGGAAAGGFQFFNEATGFILGVGAVATDIPAGTPVNAGSGYTAAGQADATAFRTTGLHVAGIRFQNEATGVINYGWIEFNNTAAATSNGFPSTVTRYCYQNDGTGITSGTTPVSLQNFSVD